MRVGVLGGGQLGLMLADSVIRLGHDIEMYEPTPGASCERRLTAVTNAPWEDLEQLGAWFDRCDVVTYESENIPAEPLRALGPRATDKLRPGLHVLEVVQDRVKEKRFCTRAGLPCADYRVLEDIRELPSVAADFGFPFILKTATGGYDGKGQFRVEGLRDLGELAPLRNHAPGRWVVEEIVDIVVEVSCIVARQRTADGDRVQTFPIFENDHRDHILDVTVLPARITEAQAVAARDVAIEAARQLDAEGLITVEFFFVREAGRAAGLEVDGLHLRVNEFAPRTHNSGHVSRKACTLSQFDQLARLLVGLEPGVPRTLPGGWAMAQMLGEIWEAQDRTGPLDLSAWSHHPDVLEVFDYGKTAVRTQRKMGHLIAHGLDADGADGAARAFRDALCAR